MPGVNVQPEEPRGQRQRLGAGCGMLGAKCRPQSRGKGPCHARRVRVIRPRVAAPGAYDRGVSVAGPLPPGPARPHTHTRTTTVTVVVLLVTRAHTEARWHAVPRSPHTHCGTPVACRQICRTEAPTAFPTGPNTEGVGAGRVRVKTEASVGENDRRRRASSALRPKHTGRVARTASSHYLPRAGMVLVLAAEAALSRLAMRCRSATVSCWIRSSFCWYIVSSRARYLPRRAPLVRPGARPASACACHTGIPARYPRRFHASRYCCAGPVHARPT